MLASQANSLFARHWVFVRSLFPSSFEHTALIILKPLHRVRPRRLIALVKNGLYEVTIASNVPNAARSSGAPWYSYCHLSFPLSIMLHF